MDFPSVRHLTLNPPRGGEKVPRGSRRHLSEWPVDGATEAPPEALPLGKDMRGLSCPSERKEIAD